MKRSAFLFIFFLAVNFLCDTTFAADGNWKITQVTVNKQWIGLGGLQANENGQLVWHAGSGYEAFKYEIFLYDGKEVKQITDNKLLDSSPQINNVGDVVWMQSDTYQLNDSNILLYKNSTIAKINDATSVSNQWPQLNNNGRVVWQSYQSFQGSRSDIFGYDGRVAARMSDDSCQIHSLPRINHKNDVAWIGRKGNDYELFIKKEGGPIKQITEDKAPNKQFSMNDSGSIVFSSAKGISLYEGTAVKALSPKGIDPQINNQGVVAWVDANQIFYYDKSAVKQITDTPSRKTGLRLSEQGYLVWLESEEEMSPISGVFFYDTKKITPLANDPLFYYDAVTINGNTIAWIGDHLNVGDGRQYFPQVYKTTIPEPAKA